MKKILTILFVFFVLFPFSASASDTLTDYYNTGDDTADQVEPGQWLAQTFTASVDYTITSVKLKLYKNGTATGDILVGVFATTDSKPSGSALVSVSLTATEINALSGDPGAFYEMSFGAGTSLVQGNLYAIVLQDDGVSHNNSAVWRRDAVASYTGGVAYYSDDDGSTWVGLGGGVNSDFMFETYGIPDEEEPPAGGGGEVLWSNSIFTASTTATTTVYVFTDDFLIFLNELAMVFFFLLFVFSMVVFIHMGISFFN